MIYLVDFSTLEQSQYLIQDEDVLYKWQVDSILPVHVWIQKRDEYKFKLEFSEDYSIVSIAVYRGGECLLCEEIQEVKYL